MGQDIRARGERRDDGGRRDGDGITGHFHHDDNSDAAARGADKVGGIEATVLRTLRCGEEIGEKAAKEEVGKTQKEPDFNRRLRPVERQDGEHCLEAARSSSRLDDRVQFFLVGRDKELRGDQQQGNCDTGPEKDDAPVRLGGIEVEHA